MKDYHNPNDYAVTHSEEEGIKIRKDIWKVFWILLAITTLEVMLGIFHQAWGIDFSVVKITFIVMTLIKAYFIVAEYMHLKHENSYLKKLIIIPYVFLAIYLLILILIEGGYSEKMMHWMF
jgi:cytochrome c oxidase subunit IV